MDTQYDASDIIKAMRLLLDHADDTLWLTKTQTIFEHLWNIVYNQDGDEQLAKEFPEYM